MAQKKLQRFNEIKTFPNVFEYPKDIAGKWHTIFENHNPITLELACGKGEYAIGLGKMHPYQNYIGIDLKGNRIWVGAKHALTNNLNNVRFLRTQIVKIEDYFAQNEVDEIWITFPDPQLRTSKAGKRLTHPRFLRLYQKFLKPEGLIHLKTDSPHLYSFTKTVAELFDLQIEKDINDLYATLDIAEELKIKTYYESLDIAESNKIFYLSLRLPKVIPHREELLENLLKQSVEN